MGPGTHRNSRNLTRHPQGAAGLASKAPEPPPRPSHDREGGTDHQQCSEEGEPRRAPHRFPENTVNPQRMRGSQASHWKEFEFSSHFNSLGTITKCVKSIAHGPGRGLSSGPRLPHHAQLKAQGVRSALPVAQATYPSFSVIRPHHAVGGLSSQRTGREQMHPCAVIPETKQDPKTTFCNFPLKPLKM
jgi:hypothetical protein